MRRTPAPRVTLLTDFGTRDAYVGALKGVLAAGLPGVFIDDVSHEVTPGDVSGAAYALARYWRLYPEGTVHLVVVDPGVGTRRRAIALDVDGRYLVAPDNGLVSRALDEAAGWTAVEIVEVAPPPVPSGRSSTFHGRDIFAPAAVLLGAGRSLAALGAPIHDPVRLEEPAPRQEVGGGSGVIVAVDHFGNLLTNVPGAWLRPNGSVEVAGRRVGVAGTYGGVAPGVAVALVSSDGRVEVAVRGGSAAGTLGVGVGATVTLHSGR